MQKAFILSVQWKLVHTTTFGPWKVGRITVRRTQPGPPNVFLPITRRVQNKRIRVRSYRTNRKWGTCGEKFISINEKATKYLLKGTMKNVGWPRLSSLHCNGVVIFKRFISNGNWTEWSTIHEVIAQVILKSDECEARGWFEITSTITPWIVWHEVQLLIINRIYNKFRN